MTGQGAFQIFVGGEAVPGLMFYGLDRPGGATDAAFPLNLWPTCSSLKEFMLGGEGWRVRLWEVAIEHVTNSPEFGHAIDSTLESLLRAGCAAAWVGIEGYFCDPPSLFLPDCMSGGVFALRTQMGRHWNSFVRPGEWHAAPDELLRDVRDETIALSGAES